MTESEGGHPMAVAAWILLVGLLIAGTAGVVGGILSRSLVVDLVAMWPLLAVVLMVGLIGWLRRRRRRASAILPLAIFTALVLAAALHLGRWDRLPSAQARLTGPPASELSSETGLTAQVVGDLELGAAPDDVGYRVEPIMAGGLVGVPQATETSVDGEVTVELSAADAPSWYTFSGWRLELSPAIEWRLVLNGRITADLNEVVVTSAAVAGSGTLVLGAPGVGGSVIAMSGDFVVNIPSGVPVEVEGEASVPDGWETAGSVHRSPTVGEDPWRIRVEGDAPVRIVER